MAIQANNPRIRRGRGKATKQKKDTFNKKEWLTLNAPSSFSSKVVGKTLTSKLTGKQTHEKQLVGRTFECFQNDLIEEGDANAHQRKFKFSINRVAGTECHSQFAGMSVTSDLRQSIVKRNHSLIEHTTDIETSDDYLLRILTIAITKRNAESRKRTCYANTTQIKETRQTMERVLKEKMNGESINTVIDLLADNTIGLTVAEESALSITNSHIVKVKVVKKPTVY